MHGLQATPPMARAAELFEGRRARPPRGASSALRVARDAEARRQLHGPSQLLSGTEATAAERGADCSGLPTPVPTSACTGARPGSGDPAAPAPSDAICAANRESNQGDVHLERLVFHEGPSWNGGNRSKFIVIIISGPIVRPRNIPGVCCECTGRGSIQFAGVPCERARWSYGPGRVRGHSPHSAL